MEKSIAQLLPDAIAPGAQTQQNRNRKIWIPEFARFRVAFVYRNGGRNYIPSYDTHKNIKIGRVGEEDGFYGLLERIILPARDKRLYVSALICCKLGDDLRTYIDGRIALDYNFILFKHTLNQQPLICPSLRFDKSSGKLDIEVLKRTSPEWWNEKHPQR